MSVPKHLEEAASRLEEATTRIEQARASPTGLDSLRAWLEALTDYAEALSDVHRFANESIHERLHELAARLRIEHGLERASAAPPLG